ncbi:MAG: Na+/H+ antiporter NhaA, partial [Aeromicrobium erythreum]
MRSSAIALFYTDELHVVPLLVALVALGLIALVRLMPSGRGPLYAVLSVVVWFGLHEAGVHATLAAWPSRCSSPSPLRARTTWSGVVELTR